MAETNEENQNSESSDGGGETTEKQTTGKTPEELKQIADDQRKRAEKAEAENKELKAKLTKPDDKPKHEDQTKIKSELTPLQQAQALRPYQDLDDTQAEMLEQVQKATGLSPAEAKKAPLFTAWNDKYVEVQKKETAKMGASKGSSQYDPEEESTIKSGMNRDDHKEAWEKMVGRK